jgi:putative membrane protein
MTQWLLATLHLLALGIGLGAVWTRAQALRGPLDAAAFRRVFHADAWWGLSGVLWLVTGLLRAFGGYEKGTDYYVHSHVFMTKMLLFVVVLALEFPTMIALIRWRAQLGRGQAPDTCTAGRLARMSLVQAVAIVVMVLAATAMARGIGMP